MLVGSLLGVVALQVVSDGSAYLWPQAKVAAQIFTGAYIGSCIKQEDFKMLSRLWRPYLFIMFLFLVCNLIVSFVIHILTGLDLLSSFLAASPSGISNTPLLAMEMGADVTAVTLFQFVRMVFGLAVLPTLIALANRKTISKDKTQVQTTTPKGGTNYIPFTPFLPVLLVAFVAGILGRWSKIPAGTMTAAIISVAALELSGKCPPMPPWIKRVAQVITGACIGCNILKEHLVQLGEMILPSILLCIGFLLCCILGGLLVSRIFHFELREAMLALSPAGASEMALIASDLGVESTNLVVLQIGRLVGVLLLFPHIFTAIVNHTWI